MTCWVACDLYEITSKSITSKAIKCFKSQNIWQAGLHSTACVSVSFLKSVIVNNAVSKRCLRIIIVVGHIGVDPRVYSAV